MKLCRFILNRDRQRAPRVGLVRDDKEVVDFTTFGIETLELIFEMEEIERSLTSLSARESNVYKLEEIKLLPPVERQEIWAAGVTYMRSKSARMEESQFSASAYDRVYDAPRPELFFKAVPEKVSGQNDPIGKRKDSRWTVPEPELALIINSRGRIVGYTIGNDMSARDIEGENLLYLPQAKIYKHSCALGPWVRLGVSEKEVRDWSIKMRIERDESNVFEGETAIGLIKRRFQELVNALFMCQEFPFGAVLLTGTGIVPPDDFSVKEGDVVSINVSGLGTLINKVVEV